MAIRDRSYLDNLDFFLFTKWSVGAHIGAMTGF